MPKQSPPPEAAATTQSAGPKLIEIHMLQNHVPANLNRDDLGAPKTAVFGGTLRARISSQCLKRSVRNPGRPSVPGDLNSPFEGGGIFAEGMKSHLGIRTKLFPWLVEQRLLQVQEQATKEGKQPPIPATENARIVLRAKKIAQSKEKEEKEAKAGERTDSRPRTPQLVHISHQQVDVFIEKLAGLRTSSADQYEYFLDPRAGFEETVSLQPELEELEEKDRKKIVKASWLIAKCRMNSLLEGTDEEEPDFESNQPGDAHAAMIAKHLAELTMSSPEDKDEKKKVADKLKALLKKATDAEKQKVKDDAPEKPKGMDAFLSKLMTVQQINPVDVALFGRMTTSEAFANVDAAMSVAHAISTHVVMPQSEFWTGVDDLNTLGAGHLGEALFNSATFYKYASLDWPQLLKNLNGTRELALKTLECFLKAFALETPSGKRHSHGHSNPPNAILIEIRDKNLPTNYANAFVKPVDVDPKNGDLVFNSAKRLQFYVEKVQDTYANKPQRRFWLWMPNEEGQDVAIKDSDTFTAGKGQTKLDALVEALRRAVETWGAA